jgi:hypothetical protein
VDTTFESACPSDHTIRHDRKGSLLGFCCAHFHTITQGTLSTSSKNAYIYLHHRERASAPFRCDNGPPPIKLSLSSTISFSRPQVSWFVFNRKSRHVSPADLFDQTVPVSVEHSRILVLYCRLHSRRQSCDGHIVVDPLCLEKLSFCVFLMGTAGTIRENNICVVEEKKKQSVVPLYLSEFPKRALQVVGIKEITADPERHGRSDATPQLRDLRSHVPGDPLFI